MTNPSSSLALAKSDARGRAEEQGMVTEERERDGKGSGGGQAIGSKNLARAPAQSAQYGYIDRASQTASATMSNVNPLDDAKPTRMPAPKAEPASACSTACSRSGLRRSQEARLSRGCRADGGSCRRVAGCQG
ncbi:MAG: hypothetical protein QM765_18195 [Myxococcales bacterium]